MQKDFVPILHYNILSIALQFVFFFFDRMRGFQSIKRICNVI
ncbi:hypothetical protein HH_1058 [Helicobacter hepaticus ATCC 51449]|uniref:Uncharacterized protein n=1 Tax=Helicobacter hepaticus (strain ATCC 51449 / 3B1) TaxID=235279 RepID=Q7VHA9_HELHP|nr:hypothetical protein HH_1058 [Helicobacter hepaticus ATCC 51449]